MRKRVRCVLAAGVGVLLFALTACGGGPFSGMRAADGSSASPSSKVAVNPADLMFVVMMIPHHEQAVEMSDLLLDKPDIDADVRRLAEQIKSAQQPEIEQMQGWLTEWGIDAPDMNKMNHSGHMDGMLSEDEIDALQAADGLAGQKLFLTGMIAHHEGAIDMANNVLGVGKDPDVRTLAQGIVTSQQAEIDQMETMLAR